MVRSDSLAAAQRANVPPFQVMEVLTAAAARQRSRGDVVSLAAGQPSSPAPRAVREAAAEALQRHSLGYTEQLGLPELRDAVASHYHRDGGPAVERDEVVMTTGASGGFLLAFLSAFDAGDRVALARPGYPAYRNILRALGCEVVELPCDESTRFQPTVAMLEELDEPVQGLIVASPANPTGTVLTGDELAELAGWCDERGVQLISDEIYHGIGYGEPLRSAREFSTEAIVVNSFSKFWCMTGWRLGWMLVPPRLRRAVDSLTGNFTLCPPALSQYGAIAAFGADAYAEAAEHVRRYETNRELLLSGLAELGIKRVAPADGAFYAYADIGDLTDDSALWCHRLLEETGVAVVPGADFDPERGDRFVRMSFAGATEDIAESVARLASWLT
ncbi:aspartate/methionine/tyrosine aminotransferase [Saccharopolyspora gloriosae]|uniref:Aspartate/methionine/tyrosine aminotransferase n=1 Tax=Saccharopolyspora gloriosae TaxID=455344 RepID=A0A840NMH7_9PSEU|nr:pyridoxal phosphate-dependent aminotransferase [Saccharopolyspora gloriosae]MBB5072754.1 aspartate/methionine/tyrosine aminotransferase [Saccharopolyspora gloriosae]